MVNSAILWLSVFSVAISIVVFVLKLERYMVINKGDGGEVGKVSFPFAQCATSMVTEI